MFCQKCGKEIAEGTRFCVNCGAPVLEPATVGTASVGEAPVVEAPVVEAPVVEVPVVETPTDLEGVAEEKKPKKKLGLLIGLIGGAVALLVIAFFVVSFIFGWFGIGRGAPKDLYKALYNLAAAENFTVEATVSVENDYYDGDTYTYDVKSTDKVDFAKGIFLSEGQSTNSDTDKTYKFGSAFEKDFEYNYSNGGNTKVYSASITEKSDKSKNVTAAYKVALKLLESGEIDVDALLKLEYMSSVKEAIDDGEFTKKDLEKTLVTLYENLNDKQWLEENLGFSCLKQGNDQIYSFNTNAYQIQKTVIESFRKLIDEKDYTSAITQLEKRKKSGEKNEIVIAITVSCDTIKKVEITNSNKSRNGEGKNVVTWVVTDIGKTEVSTNDIRKTILKANSDHITCSACGENEAQYAGLCYDCYYETYCEGLCGKPFAEDCNGYCEDCYIPCVACMDSYGSEHNDKNGKDYCYSCFDDMFCDCGATIYKDGKCKEHFKPCEICEEEHATEYNPKDEDMYCYGCYSENFCECGEDIYRDGHCEDCFVPCISCSVNHGETFYLDYCGTCYYERYCNRDCGTKIYKDGRCKEHFTPCAICEDRNANYGELCSYCDSSYFKCEECGEYEDNYDEYYVNDKSICYSCRSKYEVCDICDKYVLDTYDGLCSTCYNTYDKCSICGDYESSLYDGLCSYCYSTYEKCDLCGDYEYSTYYYKGYDLCWDCYYDYY